jgi:uncharacterized protein involved in outer membrane biogenesis
MRVVGRILAALVALVAVAVGIAAAAIVALVVLIEVDALRKPLASLASSALGRDVDIGGDLDLDLGWHTRLRVREVTVANAQWAEPPQMLALDEAAVAVSLSSLWRWELIIPEVVVQGAQVHLVRNESGDANWQFGPPAPDAPEQSSEEPARLSVPYVRTLRIEDTLVAYRDGQSDNDIELRLEPFVMEMQGEARDIRIRSQGQYQDRPFTLDVSAGSFARLAETTKAYPIDATLELAKMRAHVDGNLVEPLALAGVDVNLKAEGENLADLYPLAGLAVPPTPPFAIAGHLTKTGQTWRLESLDGTLGESDLRGMLAVDLSGKRPMLMADLESKEIRFKDLAGFIGAEPASEDPEPKSDGVLPDKGFEPKQLLAMDADVAFRGASVQAPGLPISDMVAEVSLQDGTLRLQPLELGVGDGLVRIFLSVYGTQDPVHVDLKSFIRRVDLKAVLRGTGYAPGSAGNLGGRIEISGNGTSVAEMLGTADGTALVVMSDGQMSSFFIELIGLDVFETLGVAISPGAESVPIRCLVGNLDVEQGVVTPRALVLDTTDTNIVGKGKVDLGQEHVDLTFIPYAKDFSPLTMRAPISVAGPLASPTIFPNPTGLGADTVLDKVLNAIATPIMGLLPPFDTEVGEDTACADMVKEAEKQADGNPGEGASERPADGGGAN